MPKFYTVVISFHTGETVAYGQYEDKAEATKDADKARALITAAYQIKVVELQPSFLRHL